MLVHEGLDQQRRLGLADEDVARRRQRLGAARPHGALHDPRDPAHHTLHDAEVVEHRHDGREEDDRRQHVEGEERPRARHLLTLRDESAVPRLAGAHGDVVPDQVAEEEARALQREAHRREDHVVGGVEDPGAEGGAQDEEGEDELEGESPEHDPPRDLFSVDADGPGAEGEEGDAEEASEAGEQIGPGSVLGDLVGGCGDGAIRHREGGGGQEVGDRVEGWGHGTWPGSEEGVTAYAADGTVAG